LECPPPLTEPISTSAWGAMAFKGFGNIFYGEKRTFTWLWVSPLHCPKDHNGLRRKGGGR